MTKKPMNLQTSSLKTSKSMKGMSIRKYLMLVQDLLGKDPDRLGKFTNLENKDLSKMFGFYTRSLGSVAGNFFNQKNSL